VTRDMGMGLGGKDLVYLDLTHLGEEFLRRRLGGILEIYQKFAGDDPTKVPMKIFPAVHYSMGGLWVDWEKNQTTGALKQPSPRNHQTSVPGLFSCGECDGTYHGANRLGANSLLSASYSGRVVGESVAAYVKGLGGSVDTVPEELFSKEKKRQESINKEIMSNAGGENPYMLHKEMGDMLRDKVSIIRTNKGLDEALEKLKELKERASKASLDDKHGWSNASLTYTRQVHDMIVLAEVITKGARMRDECRGSHWKPEFDIPIPEGKFAGSPEFEAYRAKWKENNKTWLKTTLAEHTPEGPKISYEDVDTSVLPVEEPRDYR
jgi:succinate dehydrogenase / fumarate reductase flavoprotein subunit